MRVDVKLFDLAFGNDKAVLLLVIRSVVADGPRTLVASLCNKLEHESVSICVTLVVEDRA